MKSGFLVLRLALIAAVAGLWGAGTGGAMAAANPPSAAAASEAGTESDSAETGAEAEAIAEVEEPALVLEAREIRAQLDASVERIEELNEEIVRAEGDDRVIIEHQIAETKLEYLEGVGKLVDNLVKQDEAGLDSAKLRGWIERQLPDLSKALVTHIEASESELRALRKLRVSVAPEGLAEVEDKIAREIAWLESLYDGYLANLNDLRRMELEHRTVLNDLQERFSTRADRLAGRIQLTSDKIDRVTERLAENAENTALQEELRLNKRRKDMAVAAMTKTADMMDQVELDSSAYRRQLIQATGEVTADVFKGKVAIGLAHEWLEGFRTWMREVGPGLVVKLAVFLLILLAFRVFAALIQRVVVRGIRGSTVKTSQLLNNMVLALSSRGIMLLGLLVALSQLGVELGPLLAGLGIAGFIVGFALQDSLANFAAGIMILGYHPYDVGDVIEAGGVFGTVSTMSLVSTTILTFDNQTLIVPNAKIWGDVIKNVTNQQLRRVDLEVHVGHGEDVDAAQRVLMDVLQSNPKVLDEPAPNVRLHKLLESSLEFIVRPWVATEDYWEAYWDITREIKRKFDEHGIAIPHPQRDVHLLDDRSGAK